MGPSSLGSPDDDVHNNSFDQITMQIVQKDDFKYDLSRRYSYQ